MLIYRQRRRLSAIIIERCRRDGVKANILSALSFLEAHDAINESAAIRIFEADDRRRKNQPRRLS